MGRWRGVLPLLLVVVLAVSGSAASVRWAASSTESLVSGWSIAATTATVGSTATERVTVQTVPRSAARTVEVQRKASTATTWTTVSAGTTQDDGQFTASLPVASVGVWEYRLHVPPTTTGAAVTTAPRTLTGVHPTTVSGWSTTASTAAVGYTATDGVTVETGPWPVARTVEVQRRASTESTWTPVSKGTTSNTGEFTARLPVQGVGTWQFRLVVTPTGTARSTASAPRTITSVPGAPTSIAGWSTTPLRVKQGTTLTDEVSVRAGNGSGARTVRVQRKASEDRDWSTIATGTTTRTGVYTASLPTPTIGEWDYRLVVPATRTAAGARTPARRLTALSADDASLNELRVATFNLSGANNDPKARGEHNVWSARRPKVVAQIVGEASDVVGLQEAHEGTGQYVSLRNALRARGQAYEVTDLRRGASRATRILYNTRTLDLLAKGASAYGSQVRGKTTRYLVWATFRHEASGKEFLFVNTHLSPDSSTVRARQWRELVAKVTRLTAGRPVVVVGDFNTTKFDRLTASMVPAMKSAGFGDVVSQQYDVNPPVNRRAETVVNGWVNSFNGYRRDVRQYAYAGARRKIGNGVDWIFATNTLRVKQWKVVIDYDPRTLRVRGVIPSDHCMLSSIIIL